MCKCYSNASILILWIVVSRNNERQYASVADIKIPENDVKSEIYPDILLNVYFRSLFCINKFNRKLIFSDKDT